MIPKIIHYCWFGRGEKPQLVQDCLASWHRYMPDWQYMEWNENNFDIASAPIYVQQAYDTKKYAFVSDYVRLWALERFGGLYMDVDFEVYKSFEDLMEKWSAFAGIEGSKYNPVMMGVCASKPHGVWVTEMLNTYNTRPFILKDGTHDMTPNTAYLSDVMEQNGFVRNGKEQDYKDLHIFTADYFSPRQTTGEFIRTENTYCSTCGLNSWAGEGGWKTKIVNHLPLSWKIKLIKLKRRLSIKNNK